MTSVTMCRDTVVASLDPVSSEGRGDAAGLPRDPNLEGAVIGSGYPSVLLGVRLFGILYCADMDLEAIAYDVGDDHVATITLNRPEALNAWDDQMASEVSWAWETIKEDDAVHAAVVQANGERAFCAGADVRGATSWFFRKNVWNTFDPGVTLSPKSHHRCWKPVVTAVHGIAAGGAQYFLNEADIIIAADDAQFFDPHATTGIVSSLEPIGMLHRGMPLGDVLRWALMGSEERITAATALRLGLVTEVVPRAALRSPRPPDRCVHRGTEPPGDPGDGAGHLGVARHDALRCPAERHRLHKHRQHIRGQLVHPGRAQGWPHLPLRAIRIRVSSTISLCPTTSGGAMTAGNVCRQTRP